MGRKKHYDIAIIGARIAGSAAAQLLARKGYKVALIDRMKKLGNTLSTHFVNPKGLTYLGELGVAEKLLEITPSAEYLDLRVDGFDVGGRVQRESLHHRLESTHGKNFPIETRYLSPRRSIIDPMLLEAAQDQNVDFFGGHSLSGIQGNKLVLLDSEGKEKALQAKQIVGADGKRSRVASLMGVQKIEERKSCTFACYSYFSGLNLPEGRIYRTDRLAYAAVPTNDNLTMVLVFGPDEFYPAFSNQKEHNFFHAIEQIDPAFREQLQNAEREEPLYATVDQAAYMRERGKYPLIGDAYSFKDQCTAGGMTHALRDAFLLAENFEDRDRFEEKRYLDSHKFYTYTCQQAEMNPMRPEELALFETISENPELKNTLVEIYTDISSPSRLFGTRAKEALHSRNVERPIETANLLSHDRYKNPFTDKPTEFALKRTVADFAQPMGRSFLKRSEQYFDFYQQTQRAGVFEYERTLRKFPGTETQITDDAGRQMTGINFASQDYLGLGSHEKLRESALRVLHEFGPHSAGSPMVIGNTTVTRELEDELRALTGKRHIVLFPTGYSAGIGSILGLVRPYDHVVLDRFSHACLQQGARGATRKLHYYNHLDPDAARAILRRIRSKDQRNAILLVTEGLFSMDADTPDLKKFEEIAAEFDATLFVDVAHDLGATGPGGTGQIGLQGAHNIDIVMGSFSKTFATNGGFVASNSEALIQYLKMYSTPHFFSNALSPLQAATALAAAKIIRSAEGDSRRQKLRKVVTTLRNDLEAQGLTCLGEVSPIVPVLIGGEAEARLIHRKMMQEQAATMILEYPVVPLGSSRFRLQVMATHTEAQAKRIARIIGHAMNEEEMQIETMEPLTQARSANSERGYSAPPA